MKTNEVKKQDQDVPVRLRDGTLECLMWWSNPNEAPVYPDKATCQKARAQKEEGVTDI
jgi:hypothetical protein